MANDEAEGHMFAWLIPGKASAIGGQIPPEPNANETAGEGSPATVAARGFEQDPPPAPLQGSESRNQPKQLKTAAELAEMIELDLARHPDC